MRLVHAQELGKDIAQGIRAVICAEQCNLGHRIAQHTSSDRVPLGMVRIEQALWRRLLHHLGQLPSQIHRILHTDVEALSAGRIMHVCGIASQQDPPLAIGSCLPSRIGESRNPSGAVDPEVGPVRGDEFLAEIAQCGFAGPAEALFGHEDPHRPPILRSA